MKDRQRKENKKKIAWAHNFLRVTYPIFCLSFVIGFWLLGLYHYWAHGNGADGGQVMRLALTKHNDDDPILIINYPAG